MTQPRQPVAGTTYEEYNTMSTNNTEVTTWADVWSAASAASEVTMKETTDWVRENPTTATATAVAVGVGIGYLLFS